MQALPRTLILLLTSVVALMARDPTGRLFVTNEGDDTVSVIDAKSGELVKAIEIGGRPRGIGFSPDRTHVYVALGDDNAIAVIDTATLAVVEKIPAGSDPEAFAVHPNGHIYLSNEDEGEASVLNPENGEILAQIKVGIEPEGVAIGPDASHVYVTSESTSMSAGSPVPPALLSPSQRACARMRSPCANAS